MRWFVAPILVLALALAGCGGGSSGDTGSTDTPSVSTTAGHPRINELGLSEPEGPIPSCPHQQMRVREEIAKLKRRARHDKSRLGTDEITVSCPPGRTPGDRVQGSHRQR